MTERIERATAVVRRALGQVSDAVGSDISQMQRVATHAVDEVRDALQDAADALREVGE